MQDVETLLLGPGGSRGIMEVGALMFLQYFGYLNHIKKVVGVSVGSIIGLLWVSGYSLIEIALESLDFSILNSDRSFFDANTWLKITEEWGGFSIAGRLEMLLRKKFGLIPTLRQLYQATGKQLVCVTTNLTQCQAEFLDYLTDPDLSAVEAVLRSSNIPGVCERMIGGGHLYIDGALRAPYPADKFPEPILGLYIRNLVPRNLSTETGIPGLLRFLFFAYNASMDELARQSLANSKNSWHIILHSDVLDTTGITVDVTAKLGMLANGYFTAMRYCQKNTCPEK